MKFITLFVSSLMIMSSLGSSRGWVHGKHHLKAPEWIRYKGGGVSHIHFSNPSFPLSNLCDFYASYGPPGVTFTTAKPAPLFQRRTRTHS